VVRVVHEAGDVVLEGRRLVGHRVGEQEAEPGQAGEQRHHHHGHRGAARQPRPPQQHDDRVQQQRDQPGDDEEQDDAAGGVEDAVKTEDRERQQHHLHPARDDHRLAARRRGGGGAGGGPSPLPRSADACPAPSAEYALLGDSFRASTAILFIGDVVGRAGRRTVRELLPRLREELAPDFVVANGENAAGGIASRRRRPTSCSAPAWT